MKSTTLTAPLVKSAVVLVVLALLAFLTSTTPDGSLWSSIGSIFIGLFRAVQFAVGLALGLVLSLAVLIGIFLGAVALFDKVTAAAMYAGLKERLAGWFQPAVAAVNTAREGKVERRLQEYGQQVGRELLAGVEADLGKVSGGQELQGRTIEAMGSRLASLEDRTAGYATVEAVEALGRSAEEVRANLAEMEAAVKAIDEKISALPGAQAVADVQERLNGLEQQAGSPDLGPVESTIAELRAEVGALREQIAARSAAEAAPAEEADPAGAADEDAEHRLFVYFDNEEDREKLAELVASTLKKDMTYAQVTEFVIKGMGKEGGRIIAEHPSLIKDYIRECRRAS